MAESRRSPTLSETFTPAWCKQRALGIPALATMDAGPNVKISSLLRRMWDVLMTAACFLATDF